MTSTNKSVASVLEDIRSGIQRGRYAPGQRLVTSELAEQLGTSLAPVREALHILAGEGLVDIKPNKGSSVITLNAQMFIDRLQILEEIGAISIRLIENKLKNKKFIKDIGAAQAAIMEAGRRRNPHAFFAAVAASHRDLNAFSGNAYLNPMLNRLHLEYFYRQMLDYLPDEFWDEYIAHYEVMYTNLVKGKTLLAERQWRKHVRWLIGLIRQRAS